ncbi:hypothetical protein KDK95_17605 [Actinospica sp. MGRD01-02]|uniref:Glyoxalase-like domain-containing protein n=1 Tax=Actinospica acidithermotolerans TaxID=2828514 RepID=A0A941ECW5_9ACTN|nr:VOC family protein [Actinospica acidithermotolerans]MBR7828138.1 hypothetical protein [Actinospica acidithermotolerans]
MTLVARLLLFDCADSDQAQHLAEFWSTALGTSVKAANCAIQVPVPMESELESQFTDDFPTIVTGAAHSHVLFTVREGTLSEEVERLLALGATLVDDRRREGFLGAGWVLLADPVGNQFRVESNAAEIAAMEAVILNR